MITRRSFVATLLAGVPIVGLLVASEKNESRAQSASLDSAPKYRPAPKSRVDSNMRPGPQQYIVFEYIATRTAKLYAGTLVDHDMLLSLGLFPKGKEDQIPKGIKIVLLTDHYLQPTDALHLFWRVDAAK